MSMKQAVDLYTSFREKRPTKLARLKIDLPRVVAAMGHVEALDYRTTHAGKVTLYRHQFAQGSRPILAVSGNGKQLMLLGGHYEWTDRGIEDVDAKGRKISNPKHGRNINPKRGNPKGKASVTQSDMNAAARGLNMLAMSVGELKSLAKSQNTAVFAGLVIQRAALQMAASKRRMGARNE